MVDPAIKKVKHNWRAIIAGVIVGPAIAYGAGVLSQRGPAVTVLSTTSNATLIPSDGMIPITWVYDRKKICPVKIGRWLGWYQDQALTPQQMKALKTTVNHRTGEWLIPLNDAPAPTRMGLNLVTMMIPVPKGTPPRSDYHIVFQKEEDCAPFAFVGASIHLIEGPAVKIGPPSATTILVPN